MKSLSSQLYHRKKNDGECLVCKKGLNRGTKYCSQKCSGIIKTKKINKKCSTCKKYFWAFNYSIQMGQGIFCSKECKYQSLKGKGLKYGRPFQKGHKPWNKGLGNRSFVTKLRASKEVIDWRNKILTKDNYKCVWCGSTKNIEVDHIRMVSTNPWLIFDVKNGQVLCEECHKAKTKDDMGIHMKVKSALKELMEKGLIERKTSTYRGIPHYSYRAIQ